MPKTTLVTLVDLLRWRAESEPQRLAYTFLKEGVREDAAFTYGDLDRAARAIAVSLQQLKPVPAVGDRILLLYPPGLDFLAAFFGCLYAGLVPIPAPPPDTARLKRTFPRLLSILRDAGTRSILTTDGIRQHARMADAGDVDWLGHEEMLWGDADAWRAPALVASDLAYLQYTSGSTSTPKGVMLTHANVLHHLASLGTAWDYREDSVSVTWMPYFHDYGLVDGLLEPLFAGIPCYVLSPLTFIKRPQRWLEAISRYRGTHTQAPNFAYELCLEKISPAQRDGLDLSCWRVASNGAEPVRAATLKRFADYFSPSGFRADAMYPAYGLAEATLLVSTKPHGVPAVVCRADAEALEHEHRIVDAAPDRLAREVVSCGPSLASTTVAIVDGASRKRCADGHVGEIWVADAAVAAGYWGRPEDSAAVFRARIEGEADAGPFLRTGDLGFLCDGELYVTGRTKDLVIIAGVNHYPQDIEWTVQQSHPDLRVDHCAAFSVEVGGEERLVVVAEVNRPLEDWQPLFAAVRQAVAEVHEVELFAFAALRKGGILKTSSGKLQRQGCRQAWLDGSLETLAEWRKPSAQAQPVAVPSAPTFASGRIADWLIPALARQLDIPVAAIDPAAPFASLGLTSRLGVQLVGELEQWLGRDELSPTLLWEYPNVLALSAHLAGEAASVAAPLAVNVPGQGGTGGIAIIGVACRLPGAANPEVFWDMLQGKGQGLRELPAGRWDGCGIELKVGSGPGCVTTLQGGFLEKVDGFDAELFGIGRREAEIMDPQQRLLLEVAWEVLENAGLNVAELAGSDTGVFVGISTDDYSVLQMGDATAISAYTGPAKALSIAANRISYQFDFLGPSLAIDTACSSSLVAIHQAGHALRRGECSLALAGGVNLILAPQMSIALSQAGMLAPDGRCKTFDVSADGYVRGEGCALLLLKRLEDAERDGDRVLAVIRGSAVNQDGRSNGLTAPNGLAQQRVIASALAAAGVAPAEIGYVEAHGTGTPLGDPIEVKSLQAVLGQGRAAGQRCAFGAVKANIGHLEAAAGVAGVVKTVLALQHGVIPPHPTLRRINPLISLAEDFHVPTETTPWPPGRRLAGVSSFGFGGTNAHLVLEAVSPVPESPAVVNERPLHLLTLGAHDEAALRELAARWQARFGNVGAGETASDLCFSANTGRNRLPVRLAVFGADSTEIANALGDWLSGRPGRWSVSPKETRAPRIAFLFSGQGTQAIGLGAELYRTQPGFRADMDECDALLRPLLGISLLELLHGPAGDEAEAKLARTEYTQPALFALEYSLARLWLSWGIRPVAMLGHSIGEYVAACIAGVFSLADGLRLVAERARQMQNAPNEGGMLAVNADEITVRAALVDTDMVIAAFNGPRNHVLAGRREALAALAERLTAQGIESQTLKVSHAFHSPLMEPVLPAFAKVADRVAMRAPTIPIYSNVSGRAAGEELTHTAYWVDHLRQPVRFADGIRAMLADGIDAFVEIGPRPALLAMARQSAEDDNLQWLPSLRPRITDHTQMLESLGQLFVRGAAMDGRGFDAPWPRRRLDGPHYPFQHRPYWLPPLPLPGTVTDGAGGLPLPGRLVRSPLLPQSLFDNRYEVARFSLLGEHRVFGQVVVPGAAHLSLLTEAAAKLGDDVFELRDLVLPQALVVPEPGARRVQLTVGRDEEDAGSAFTLISLPDGEDEPWEAHATGRLHRLPAAGRAETLAVLRGRCATAHPGDFYADTWQAAIGLGPRFRWVAEVWRGTEEVLARLQRPVEAVAEKIRLHPGLLDSMLQILTAAVKVDADAALVPFRIDHFRVFAPAEGRVLWSHLRQRADESSAEEVVSDVRLYDEAGGLLVEAEGFRARRVLSRSLLRAQSQNLDDAVCEQTWQEVAAGGALEPGLVCRLDDIDISGDALDATVAAVQRVLQALKAALAEQKRLTLVTRHAQAVVDGDTPRPDQAAIWGLARVIRLEHSELDCRCIDLDAAGDDPLPTSGDEPDLARRAGKLWAPRLERHALPRKTPALRGDATYLISGGLGALGLALAEWLVAHGARHLLLIGRNAPDAVRAARIAALEAQGATVTVETGSISESRRWQDGVPALAGVFHLAGVLDDAMLLQTDAARLRAVLAPKLAGALALHEMSAGMALDHFVCFSSVAGVTGSLGQGAYAAANAAIDALMAARRAAGLAGSSIQWGPWAEAGMAAAQGERDRQRFADYGIEAIEIGVGMDLFGRLLAAGSGTRLVLPVRWSRYVERLHGGVAPPLYAPLLSERSPVAAAADSFVPRLLAAPAEARRSMLEQQLRETIAAVIGIGDPRQIAPRQRLFDLGLDSLGAVELRNRLAALLGKPLRATLLFDFPTLAALAEHVEKDVLGLINAPAEALIADNGGAELEHLSDDELARMLAAELGD